MITINCFVCNKEFMRKVSQIKRANYNYCGMECRNIHYKTIRRGANNYRWKGGYLWRRDGYMDVYAPHHPQANSKGYVLEHRLVMEKKLNRRLKIEEIVHHKNRIRNDNRPENLEVLTQSDHVKEHIAEMMLNRKRAKNGTWLPK